MIITNSKRNTLEKSKHVQKLLNFYFPNYYYLLVCLTLLFFNTDEICRWQQCHNDLETGRLLVNNKLKYDKMLT